MALHAALLALLATALFLLARVLFPSREALALRIDALAIAALGLLTLARMIWRTYPAAGRSPFDRARGQPSQSVERWPELEELTRLVRFANWSAGDLHHRLRPILREIAAHRLASRRGIDLDRQPDAARAVVGATAWELIRPDRPAPVDRHAPGIDLIALGAVIGALEDI